MKTNGIPYNLLQRYYLFYKNGSLDMLVASSVSLIIQLTFYSEVLLSIQLHTWKTICQPSC